MLRDEWTTYSNWCALHFLEHHRVLPCSPPALSPTPGTPPATAPCLARTAGVGRAGGQAAAPLSCPGQTGTCPASVCVLSCQHRHLFTPQRCPSSASLHSRHSLPTPTSRPEEQTQALAAGGRKKLLVSASRSRSGGAQRRCQCVEERAGSPLPAEAQPGRRQLVP